MGDSHLRNLHQAFELSLLIFKGIDLAMFGNEQFCLLPPAPELAISTKSIAIDLGQYTHLLELRNQLCPGLLGNIVQPIRTLRRHLIRVRLTATAVFAIGSPELKNGRRRWRWSA